MKKSPIMFKDMTQDGMLRLDFEYIPQKVSNEITTLICDIRVGKITPDIAYIQGKTIIESEIENIRVCPVSFIVPEGELQKIEDYINVTDRNLRRHLLNEDPKLMRLMEVYVLSNRELECNEKLKRFVITTWKRWISIENNRIKSNSDPAENASMDILNLDNDISGRICLGYDEDDEYYKLKDEVRRLMQEFYVRVAELERRLIIEGNPTYSTTPKDFKFDKKRRLDPLAASVPTEEHPKKKTE